MYTFPVSKMITKGWKMIKKMIKTCRVTGIVAVSNGCRIYVDIGKGKILANLRLLTWNSLIGQFVHPLKIRYLASCKFHFIREHENLI